MNARILSAVKIVNAILAATALLLSLYLGWLHFGLIDCLADRDAADQQRTAAISAATDKERAADLALLRNRTDANREAAASAREHTDRVRAEHPAPPVKPCR